MITYLIRNPATGLVKIGKTKNLWQRFRALQNASGTKLEILATIEKDVEEELHKRFVHLRHMGEWFKDTPDIRKAFAKVVNAPKQTVEKKTMALNLAKGNSINLTKALAGVKKFAIGLSWDANSDLDASALALNAAGKILNPDDQNVAYYRNATNNPYGEPQNPVPGIKHSGDARDGSAAGDDETITIDTSALRPDIERILVAITSYSESDPEVFGMAAAPVAKLYDEKGTVLVEVKLNEDAAFSTALEFVEFRKEAGDWKFYNVSTPVGNCSANGLVDIITVHS